MNDDRLHAYLDGELTEAERREVEDWLARDPQAQARLAAYRAQNRALHAAFDPVLDEPHTLSVPAASRAVAWRTPLALAATLALGIAIGALGAQGWRGEAARGAPLARQATLAYAAYQPEVRHPVEVTAAEEQHLVAWLSKRLTAPLKVPVLASAGYRLLGGRLLPAPNAGDAASPVAQLMYENAQGRRLTLLVRRDDGNRDTAFRTLQEGNTQVFYWIDRPFGYALAGELGREEMHAIAQLVYRQLNP